MDAGPPTASATSPRGLKAPDVPEASTVSPPRGQVSPSLANCLPGSFGSDRSGDPSTKHAASLLMPSNSQRVIKPSRRFHVKAFLAVQLGAASDDDGGL
ncbi:hypothetical protein BD626DRAFT_482653, partial [Schizophyllum amplum]